MKHKKNFLLASLKRSYEKSPKPVLFITKGFRPFYFNEKMSSAAEELCSSTTISDFISEESRKKFMAYDGVRPLELSSNRQNYFFIAEGVFDGGRAVCYKISVEGFDDLSALSGVRQERFRISQAVSDSFTKTLKDAADSLYEITTGDIPLKLHSKISVVTKTVSDLSGLSGSLSDIVGRTSGFSSSNKRYFRVSELLSYLSNAVGAVRLPKGFDDKDDRSLIFSPKSGVAEALLRCCRFITATADRNVRIKTEISYKLEKIVIRFSANVGTEISPDPFSLSFGDGGIFNYGLRDARAFIEDAGGNLLVTKTKAKLSVFVSFPTVNASAVPSGIFDSMDSGFEPLLYDIGEYAAATEYLKTKA